jgi:predicted phosphodiesterase
MQTFLAEINRKRPRTGATPRGTASPEPARPEPPKQPDSGRPFALLADIHSNAAALEAVLAELDRDGITEALVLGDLVGYGPEPGECIRLIRERGYSVLMGNHDYGVAHGEFQKGFSSHGRQVAEWTAACLSQDDMEWLAALPNTLTGDGWMAVHGAPADKARMIAYVYRMTYEKNLDYLARHQVRTCFHGHTHIEGVYYRRDDGDGFCDDAEQSLAGYRHSLVCPGSLGPKGTQARYAIIDPASWRLEIKTVPYDLDRTLRAMHDLGLPKPLAQRLLDGT